MSSVTSSKLKTFLGDGWQSDIDPDRKNQTLI
jgi:hypothetical protein